MKKSVKVWGLVVIFVVVGSVFGGMGLAAVVMEPSTQVSAQNELNSVTSFTADDNLNVRITNVNAAKFQAYFAQVVFRRRSYC